MALYVSWKVLNQLTLLPHCCQGFSLPSTSKTHTPSVITCLALGSREHSKLGSAGGRKKAFLPCPALCSCCLVTEKELHCIAWSIFLLVWAVQQSTAIQQALRWPTAWVTWIWKYKWVIWKTTATRQPWKQKCVWFKSLQLITVFLYVTFIF